MTSIDGAVRALADAKRALVMTDYDGTLAPFVGDPTEAVVDERTMTVLQSLLETDGTTVAVVSGRRRADLEEFLPIAGLVLVGGHGAETGGETLIGGSELSLLGEVTAGLERIAALDDGVLVERKPTSVALHVRGVDPARRQAVLSLAREGPGRVPGVRVIEGKMMVDLTVSPVDKGAAVRTLRARNPNGLAVFIGDDITDESAFAALVPPDIGVKVGEGPSAAPVRLPGQRDVVPFLEAVARGRRR